MFQIVVSDPEGKYVEGDLVNHNSALLLRGRKGISMPVDPGMFQVAGCGGFFKRMYGEGFLVEHTVPKQFCPMTLYLLKAHRVIHWAVRLIIDPKVKESQKDGLTSLGTIQLASTPPRGNVYQATLTPRTQAKALRDLGPPDAEGGWTIEGTCFVNVMNDGNHSFSLYGSGQGVRVAWTAITAVQA